MKTYVGSRMIGASAHVTVQEGSGGAVPLNPRHDLRNHSPDGFEWGYGGSGPAQLALAILADLIGDERAQAIYQDFKFKIISAIKTDKWIMRDHEIMCVVRILEESDAPTPA